MNTNNRNDETTQVANSSETSTLTTPWSTFDAFFDKLTGTWQAHRTENVHAPAIRKLFAGKRAVLEKKPRLDMLMGGLGVGKSTLARQLSAKYPNSILIDADALKLEIPEFEWFKRENLRNAYLRVHDESRHIAQEALACAVRGRFDVILDFCNAEAETHALILELREKGYLLALECVDCPLEQATERIKAAARVPGVAHYGRSMFRREIDPPPAEQVIDDFPEGWEFVPGELFAGREEYELWVSRLNSVGSFRAPLLELDQSGGR